MCAKTARQALEAVAEDYGPVAMYEALAAIQRDNAAILYRLNAPSLDTFAIMHNRVALEIEALLTATKEA